jgi:hypothetical protein
MAQTTFAKASVVKGHKGVEAQEHSRFKKYKIVLYLKNYYLYSHQGLKN